MIGAGFMGRGIALQVLQSTVGMRLVAIANRHLESAERAYREAGADDVQAVETLLELESAIHCGRYAITDDALLLCRATNVDVVIEVTGAVEFSAHVTLEAIRHGKPVVLMNAELDSTIGPILRVHAQKAGVLVTNCDGDQPGVIMNLYRFVRGLGVRPVLCGNIKGLQDPYRNPTTQAGFAQKWGQNPMMVTSFADGTKISFEQAIVANATGMRVGKRGMYGPTVPEGTPVTEAVNWYPADALLEGPGIVDYVVGASPGPGVFVLGTHENPRQRHYLNLYNLGKDHCTAFIRHTTSVTSRCRTRSRGLSISETRRWRRTGRQWWTSSPLRRSTSLPERSSTESVATGVMDSVRTRQSFRHSSFFRWGWRKGVA